MKRIPGQIFGYQKFCDLDGYPAVKPPWGTLNAIDLNPGEYLWTVPLVIMISHSPSKRQFVKCLAALGGTALLPACQKSGDANSRSSWLPGLQLYTLGEAPKEDLEGTLQQVAAIGYRAVEFPGPYDRAARQLRHALDGAGLVCPSVHVPLESLQPGGWDLDRDLAKVADGIKVIGASYAVVGGPRLPDSATEMLRNVLRQPQPDRSEIAKIYESLSPDTWKRNAYLLNEKGAMLARSGLRIAYHNHAMEFLVLSGGRTGYDILVEHTDPDIVDFQLDTGWVASAGRDPVAVLQKLGGRVRLMHLKDVEKSSDNVSQMAPADTGTGIIDWEKLIPVIQRAGIQHLFVEQESPFPISRMESIRIAYQFLSRAFAGAS